MLNSRRARSAPAGQSRQTGRAEPSQELAALVEPMAPAWPSHARRCLKQPPERLGWATPVLDPEHPGELNCTADRARELVSRLEHRPSREHLLVGCHPRRPA